MLVKFRHTLHGKIKNCQEKIIDRCIESIEMASGRGQRELEQGTREYHAKGCSYNGDSFHAIAEHYRRRP